MAPPKTRLPRRMSKVARPPRPEIPAPRRPPATPTRPGPPSRTLPKAESSAKLLGAGERSLLDVIDNLLTQGVVVSGDAMLGVADVDLVYLKLTALLCAADRVLPGARGRTRTPR